MQINCDFCRNNSVSKISSCQKLNTISCPYKLQIEQYNKKNQHLGIMLFLFGITFFAVSVYFSASNISTKELWTTIILSIFSLPFLFVGFGLSIAGLFIMVGKQYTFSSTKSYSFMLYKVFNITIGHTINSPLEEIKTVVSDEVFKYPLSILLLNESKILESSNNSLKDAFKLIKSRVRVNVQRNSSGAFIEQYLPENNAMQIIRGVLIYLISQDILKVKKHKTHNYILNFQLKNNQEKTLYLIFKGSNFDNYIPDSILENKLINIVKNWQQIKELTESPFSPEISSLTRYLLDISVFDPTLEICKLIRQDGANKNILKQMNNDVYLFKNEFIEIAAASKDKIANLEEKFKLYNKEFFESLDTSIMEGLRKRDSSD